MEPTMTFATSAASCPKRRAGFSLIELLVVLGIILVLAGILIPVVIHSMHSANRSRIAADLQSVTVALEQYRQDWGDYPRLDPASPGTGAAVLERATMGLGDSVDHTAAYSASTGYSFGDLVQQAGVDYVCIVAGS